VRGGRNPREEAKAYVNTALVFEQLGNYQAAFDFLKIYFVAAPDTPDREQMKTKLYELEFKAQQGKK
jgi:regulator of sirC expression with transglutaminase-like and TPR domain